MTSKIILVVSLWESLLSLGFALNVSISFPFQIHDLASMIEPNCYCRIFASEIESSNFNEPQVACEVADIRQEIQEKIHRVDNVNVKYTKRRKFVSLKYACFLNITYVKDQVSLHNYVWSSYKPTHIKGETVSVQMKTYDIIYLARYVSFIRMNIGNSNRLFKLEMRLQYSFVVVNQNKQIPPNFPHFTSLFATLLSRLTWY